MSECEQRQAMKMYLLGYNYIIWFSEHGPLKGRILFVKTIQCAVEMMRTDFKNEKDYSILRLNPERIYNMP